MGSIELTVTSCIHLIRSKLKDHKPLSIGSGVIIKYKCRYFICTVSHFSDYKGQSVGIATGRMKNNQTEVYYLGDFSYLTQLYFDEGVDLEDFEYCISNPERSGDKLDIAFREIELLDNIIQHRRVLELNGLGTITVNEGSKTILIVDDKCEIDVNELCNFYGRIRPDFSDGVLTFEEKIYWGLPIKSVSEHFIEMDLGAPIRDHSRFKGCSGAPIIDTRGRIIGLVTHGDKDPGGCSVYGFRFDKVKQWIDLMYFQEPMRNL